MKIKGKYAPYSFSLLKSVKYGVLHMALWGALGFLFYRSLPETSVLILIGSPISLYRQKQRYAERKKVQLSEQFKDSLLSLSASLRAGYSVENAWSEVLAEMISLYGSKSAIVVEVTGIVQRLKIGVPVESILYDFGERSDIEDIKDFANVFKVAKRGGGDMVGVISSTAKIIADKYDVQREINNAIAAKKYEERIMMAMPAAVIAYMNLTNPGFLDILYQTGMGKIIMTGCLLVYGVAYLWGEKIVDINI